MLSRFSMNVYLRFKSFNCIVSFHISCMYSGRLKGERFYFATRPFEIECHWPLLESVLTLKTSLNKKTWIKKHGWRNIPWMEAFLRCSLYQFFGFSVKEIHLRWGYPALRNPTQRTGSEGWVTMCMALNC